MDKIYVGKIVSTHGIKGEIKIVSDFQFKEKVFVVGNKLIIDDLSYEIKSYRKHKNYDMVLLGDFNNINDVLFMMKKNVYFDKNSLKLLDDEVLDSDLLKFKVVNGDLEGYVEEIFFASNTNKIIRVNINGKSILVPFNSPMFKRISKDEKILYLELIEGIL